MNPWVVLAYTTERGKNPVKAFIQSFSQPEQEKILVIIAALEENGINVRVPHSKSIQGHKNLFELRVKLSNSIQRIFYFHYQDKTFILLHGFTKKTQETPKTEIETALKRRADYLQRHPLL